MFAAKADVQRLVLFHHDPLHTDVQLDRMRDDVAAAWGVADGRCVSAAEGMTFEV
jgi:phosphoribosyl 1,2-cyclic phosphodiesterase